MDLISIPPFLQLLPMLLPLSDFNTRVDMAVDLIASTHKNVNRGLLHFAAATFYDKLKAADVYVPVTKYHGNVTLLRAETSSEYGASLGADYKLSEVIYIRIITYLVDLSLCYLNSQ